MICLIRIKGRVGVSADIGGTLFRLRLRKKYSCVVINPTKEESGMIKKVRDFIAFGEIDKATFEKLIEQRGKTLDKSKKLDAKKVVEGIEKGEKYDKLNLKPFFSMHPPRGGIETKKHFPKGVLGDHGKDINKLLERML